MITLFKLQVSREDYEKNVGYSLYSKVREIFDENNIPVSENDVRRIADKWFDDHRESIAEAQSNGDTFEIDEIDVVSYLKDTKHDMDIINDIGTTIRDTELPPVDGEIARTFTVSVAFTWMKGHEQESRTYTFASLRGCKEFIADEIAKGDIRWYAIEGLAHIPCDKTKPYGQTYQVILHYEFHDLEKEMGVSKKTSDKER